MVISCAYIAMQMIRSYNAAFRVGSDSTLWSDMHPHAHWSSRLGAWCRFLLK
jgi:hypothetical protein